MDKRKLPYNFQPDPEMQRIKLLARPPVIKPSHTAHNFQKRKYQGTKYTVNKYSKTIRKYSGKKEYYMAQEDYSRPVRRVRKFY